MVIHQKNHQNSILHVSQCKAERSSLCGLPYNIEFTISKILPQ
jgi:hypothetical protein